MKIFSALLLAALLHGGIAAAEGTGTNSTPQYLTFPTWYEVVDIIKQGKTKPEGEERVPGPRKGGLHPYFGFNEVAIDRYLIPGNMLDISGGVCYYVPRNGKEASVGLIFAVKDRISNRLEGYTFETDNLTPYISFSISY